MSNRPSIPAEIAREILIESGHRCAVCGAGCPLERAHIIPWHKSREHKAEDLICLCANCHQRADHEGWGERTLREYKRRPWVMRYEKTDNIPEPKTEEIQIVIDMKLDRFDERFQRLLKSGLAGFLEISPNSVRITSMGEGSVKVTIELPTQSAKRLISAYQRKDSELAKFLAPLVLSDLRREEALQPKLKLPLLNYRLDTRYTRCLRQEEILHQLEMRAAKFGPLDVPVAVQNQIKETKDTIKELEDEIKQIEHSIAQIKRDIERQEKRKQLVTAPKQRFGTFMEWPAFNQYARDAREIFISGGSLDNLIQLYGYFLVEKAKVGCEVRLILMDPESPAIPQVELWSDPKLPPDFYRGAICRSLRLLAVIDSDRKLQIRLNPSIPALTVMILDGSRPDGRIRVDIQPFQATVVDRPIFELTRQGEDLQWYNLFYRQYYAGLWSMAKPVDLSDLPSVCLRL